MSQRRPDDSGQAAMVDAILFMTVMLVACAVVIGSSGAWTSDIGEREALQQYTRDFAGALLPMELEGLYYTDREGEVLSVGTSSVARLLCDEAMMLASGGTCDFTDYEAGVMKAARALLRPGLDCALSCGDVFIGGAGDVGALPPDRCAAGMTVLPEGSNGPEMSITVYVWVV